VKGHLMIDLFVEGIDVMTLVYGC